MPHRQLPAEDLVKLRRQAALPPEALEPLSAFRGDVRWHFDARQRLEQKLQGAAATTVATTVGLGLDPGTFRLAMENHRETIGKCWFHGM